MIHTGKKVQSLLILQHFHKDCNVYWIPMWWQHLKTTREIIRIHCYDGASSKDKRIRAFDP